jgi:hypothetical protein
MRDRVSVLALLKQQGHGRASLSLIGEFEVKAMREKLNYENGVLVINQFGCLV